MKNNHQRFVTYSTILLLACLSIPVIPAIVDLSAVAERTDPGSEASKSKDTGARGNYKTVKGKGNNGADAGKNAGTGTVKNAVTGAGEDNGAGADAGKNAGTGTVKNAVTGAGEDNGAGADAGKNAGTGTVKNAVTGAGENNGAGAGKPKDNDLLGSILNGLHILLHILEIAGLVRMFIVWSKLQDSDKEKNIRLNNLTNDIDVYDKKLQIQESKLKNVDSELATAKHQSSRINEKIDKQLTSQQGRNEGSYQNLNPGYLSRSESPKSTPAMAPSAYPFLDLYRQNPDRFKSQYAPIPVSEIAENLQKRWAGDQQEIVLGEDRQGNYWLVTEGNTTYLIPNTKLKINDINMRTVGGLFDCGSYIPGYRSLNIIRPAIVSSLLGTSDRRWRLEQKGVLEFT
jgi:hypothetical protein